MRRITARNDPPGDGIDVSAGAACGIDRRLRVSTGCSRCPAGSAGGLSSGDRRRTAARHRTPGCPTTPLVPVEQADLTADSGEHRVGRENHRGHRPLGFPTDLASHRQTAGHGHGRPAGHRHGPAQDSQRGPRRAGHPARPRRGGRVHRSGIGLSPAFVRPCDATDAEFSRPSSAPAPSRGTRVPLAVQDQPCKISPAARSALQDQPCKISPVRSHPGRPGVFRSAS